MVSKNGFCEVAITDDDGQRVYLVNGDDLFAVQVILEAAKREVNSPASDALIDAVSQLVVALKPLASPVTPMHGIGYIPKAKRQNAVP